MKGLKMMMKAFAWLVAWMLSRTVLADVPPGPPMSFDEWRAEQLRRANPIGLVNTPNLLEDPSSVFVLIGIAIGVFVLLFLAARIRPQDEPRARMMAFMVMATADTCFASCLSLGVVLDMNWIAEWSSGVASVGLILVCVQFVMLVWACVLCRWLSALRCTCLICILIYPLMVLIIRDLTHMDERDSARCDALRQSTNVNDIIKVDYDEYKKYLERIRNWRSPSDIRMEQSEEVLRK